MRTVAFETVDRWTRSFLPAALVVIGLITFISGDLGGDHRIRGEGGGIIGAAILMAIAGASLRRPDEAARFDLHDSASSVTHTRERAVLIVRPDHAELYECAVRAFGAARVLYDRRQVERRRGVLAATIERRQSERRHRAEADFDIKAFGSAWIRV